MAVARRPGWGWLQTPSLAPPPCLYLVTLCPRRPPPWLLALLLARVRWPLVRCLPLPPSPPCQVL